MPMPGLPIHTALSAAELRGLARRETRPRVAPRLYAIAHVLDGMSRAEAARLCGMERQALRDAVVRFNTEGVNGLVDRPRPGRQPLLSEGEQAALRALVLRGPDPERSGLSSWTLQDLCRETQAALGQVLAPGQHVARGAPPGPLAAEGAAGASPVRPKGAGGVRKKGLQAALDAATAAHPGKRISLWFQDEARMGQKGRTCHRWWLKGQRPPGLCDRRFTWTYIFAAVEPATGASTALVLPEVSTEAMSVFLDRFAAERAPDEHAVLVLDQAGWHGAHALRVPDNLTLVPLPPYAPELNPIERVWLHLRERFLSHRLLDDYDAVVDACCAAWKRLTPERLRSLCHFPYIQQVIF